MTPRRRAAAAALLLLGPLAGCGQTGALYLPDEGVQTPVEIKPAPAGADSPRAGDEQRERPPGRA